MLEPSIQTYGTYVHRRRLGTLRIVYAITVLIYLTLILLDVVAAFMNALSDEELYILAPPEADQSPTGYVCQLKKTLYGLKKKRTEL